jgi:pyruvate ferredoxin oxidoreductase gamma subunit
MFQVRIHGRGGQGVVTAAELLSLAAFADGSEAQAFPSFGSERMGAPVVAFCRIDDHPIRLREPIAEPDAVIVQDPTLLHHVDVFGGLLEDGYVLINSSRSIDELALAELHDRHHPERVVTVAASDIARSHTGRPIPNATLLGALAALTRCVSRGSLDRAIAQRFGAETAVANIAAAHDAWSQIAKEAGDALDAA